MLYSTEQLVSIALTVALVMVSAIVHEVAHGWMALKCGDPTAKEAGRLTLDPRAHLSGFGSVLLPLLMAFMGGPVFAFAKPVPYNPRRLRNPRRDEVLVALAGPASNLLQALVASLVLRGLLTVALGGGVLTGTVPLVALRWGVTILTTYVYVNLVLCFFNLIPVPPLDGSRVLLYFLPGSARTRYYELERYAFVILIVALYLVPRYLGVDPVGAVLDATAGNLFDLLLLGL